MRARDPRYPKPLAGPFDVLVRVVAMIERAEPVAIETVGLVREFRVCSLALVGIGAAGVALGLLCIVVLAVSAALT